MATTRTQLDHALRRASKAINQPLAFETHNNKGYGLLYLATPGRHIITNVIAGSSGEGINRTTAYYICEALENLIYKGCIDPAPTDQPEEENES